VRLFAMGCSSGGARGGLGMSGGVKVGCDDELVVPSELVISGVRTRNGSVQEIMQHP